MPTPAAEPGQIRTCEEEIGIGNLVSAAVKEPLIVLARDGCIVGKEKKF